MAAAGGRSGGPGGRATSRGGGGGLAPSSPSAAPWQVRTVLAGEDEDEDAADAADAVLPYYIDLCYTCSVYTLLINCVYHIIPHSTLSIY